MPPEATVCRRCKASCSKLGGKPFCRQCDRHIQSSGVPFGHRRWYSPGLCDCGAMLYPFFLGEQSKCRECRKYKVVPRMARIPPSASDLIGLLTTTPNIILLGTMGQPEEPEPYSHSVAILRDLYRLCLPDIRFLRTDMPPSFYAPWHEAFRQADGIMTPTEAIDRLIPYTRS